MRPVGAVFTPAMRNFWTSKQGACTVHGYEFTNTPTPQKGAIIQVRVFHERKFSSDYGSSSLLLVGSLSADSVLQ